MEGAGVGVGGSGAGAGDVEDGGACAAAAAGHRQPGTSAASADISAAAKAEARRAMEARREAFVSCRPEGAARLGHRWECEARCTSGAAASSELSLIERLNGTYVGKDEERECMLHIVLQTGLREKWLGARELLALEGASPKCFSRMRMETLAEQKVKDTERRHRGAESWEECAGRRVQEPAMRGGAGGQLPAAPAEDPSVGRGSGASYDEWNAVRAPERRARGRLVGSGRLWEGAQDRTAVHGTPRAMGSAGSAAVSDSGSRNRWFGFVTGVRC